MKPRACLFVALSSVCAACSTTPTTPPRSVEDICVGIDETDRERDPLAPVDVVEVRSLTQGGGLHRSGQRLAGATVVLRATKGMTEQWLQRLLDCRIATGPTDGSALLGGNMVALVDGTDDAFAIRLRSSDDAVSERILTLAQQLAEQPEAPPDVKPAATP